MKYLNLFYSDKELYNLITQEEQRQDQEIELIASENYVSTPVLEALGTRLTNKYSEGYPGKRYYGGNQVIDQIEELAINRAKKLFNAEHVNVQTLSGSTANASVYSAFLNPGDKVLALRLDHGGHLTHGHPVNFSGKLYNFIHYGLDSNTGLVDMVEVRQLAQKERPKMIVAGFSAYSRNIDWLAFQKIATEVNAYTFADISHIAGLIAAQLLDSPVPIFDVVSSTTHKTLRGPRGAIIMCKRKYAKQIDAAVFPGHHGGPHNHINAAKAVAFQEALSPEFKSYATMVIKNAQTLATELKKLNYKIVSGGTENHLFVLDLRNKNLSGKEAENILEIIGISVSRSTIPNDTNPPLNPSGLRLGTAAVTTRGMKEVEMIKLAYLIHQAFNNKDQINTLHELKDEVLNLSKKYPIPKTFISK